MVVDHTVYEKGMAIMVGKDGEDVLFEKIIHALEIDEEPYILTCQLETIDYHAHFHCYIVEETRVLHVRRVQSLADKFPLGIYPLPGEGCSGIVLKHQPPFSFPQ